MRQEPEGFPEFWGVWRPHARHTDGRGLARQAFEKHLKDGACAQDMIDGAKHFFRTMKDRDKEFVPLCATWLNRGAYEELAEAERAWNERVAQRQQQTSNVVTMQVVLPKNHFQRQNRA
ncbi:hypothetical protein [Rhizobium mesoamericanum]|uniref:Uncharacterized protein n=1 Tax=Rhizobium mesoamericanum STM3625 TaxID=1211777 RepID=K0PZ87_9HYPH|nr:hypothetical protein [Rhizobium mesoamericanum]CCM77110.1 hypothetical protein BN77_4158 [Rhizobium mesoamericanum STM3625]